MYEQNCDDVLKFIVYNNSWLPGQNPTIEFHDVSRHIWLKDPKTYDILVPILKADGFIILESNGYRLTDKGKAFFYTDSYTQRSKRWELEKQLKEQQVKKLNWEVSKMRTTYIIAIIGMAVSIVSLLLSIIGYVIKVKT